MSKKEAVFRLFFALAGIIVLVYIYSSYMSYPFLSRESLGFFIIYMLYLIAITTINVLANKAITNYFKD